MQEAGFGVEFQCFQAAILLISLTIIIYVSLSTMHFYFLLISAVPYFEQKFPQTVPWASCKVWMFSHPQVYPK